MFSITHNFCSSCRVNIYPTPLHHPSFQERDPQDENVGIPFLRSESPFVFYHCQCGISAIIVSKNSPTVFVFQNDKNKE